MALLILVFFLSLVAIGYVVQSLDSASIKNARDKKTASVLAEAKAALIGWSVARGVSGTARPGEMPCPDNDAPSTFGYGYEDGTCVAGKVGRLPWKTLGIDEIRDGYGEPLWYAIDGAFRRRTGVAPSTNQPINSDTRAALLVYAADGVTKISPPGNEAVALIFSAGLPIGGKTRSPVNSVVCPATGTNILENRCASNYLESANGKNNAVNNGPYIAGYKTSTFNDQLIFITTTELMTVVEKLVGKQVQAILQDYKAVNGYYPYPAKYDAAGCVDVGNTGYFTNCQSDSSLCRGRFPDNAITLVPTNTPNWTLTNTLPLWFSYNLWGQTIYYSAGDNSLNAPVGCTPQLTVDLGNVNGLFFMPSTPIGNIVRNSPAQSITLSDYLDNPENQDGWVVANDVYITPALASKDKIYTLP